MAHPVRCAVFILLAEEDGQSAAEIAARLSLPVRSVRHQLSKLAEDGLVEVISSREKRGALEKFYEVRVTPILETADVEAMTPQMRRLATAETFRAVVRDLESALAAGSFSWNHSTQARLAAAVDEEGWREVSAIMGNAFADIRQAAEGASLRMDSSAHAGRPKRGVSVLQWFERPHLVDPGWGATAADRLSDQTAAGIFRQILSDVAGAISAGTFSRRADFCQIRMPIAVDQEGWDEIQGLSVRLRHEVEAAHVEAAGRLRAGGEPPIPATATVVWVELPSE